MTPLQRYRNSFPQYVLRHCVDRLIKREGYVDPEIAADVYFRHHGLLNSGIGRKLYHRKDDARDSGLRTVYKLHDDNGRAFYPVRAYFPDLDRIVTVTYLEEAMVLRDMIITYVQQNEATGLFSIHKEHPDVET